MHISVFKGPSQYENRTAEFDVAVGIYQSRGLSSHPVGGSTPPLKKMYSPLREDHQLPPSGGEYLF